MARLYLFAEGQTEQTFASEVLTPHLALRGVFLQPPILIAHARRGGRVHRGGGRSYAPMRDDILRFTKQERSRDVFFTTMIDLYAIHAQFPGLDEAEKLRHLPRERVAHLERAFLNDVNDPRFIPYIQLHEFEAYLFCDPSALKLFYEDRDHDIVSLCEISTSYDSPELINDGQDTAPSKRIIQALPPYKGAKAVQGPQAAALIGLDGIRSKCPHFHDWLSRLESLQ
jgi:hypothetical protein